MRPWGKQPGTNVGGEMEGPGIARTSLWRNVMHSAEQIKKYTLASKPKYQEEEITMQKEKLVSIMISLPKEIRDRLRKMAAQRNLENPDEVTSAAQIARDIICEHFAKNPSCKHNIGAIEQDDVPF